jgi:hypothetical protein
MDSITPQRLRMRKQMRELLSAGQIARVDAAEAADGLLLQGEFIDLARPDLGVQMASRTLVPMHRVLPRRAVDATTWSLLLRGLSEPTRPTTAVGLDTDRADRSHPLTG